MAGRREMGSEDALVAQPMTIPTPTKPALHQARRTWPPTDSVSQPPPQSRRSRPRPGSQLPGVQTRTAPHAMTDTSR